MIPGSNLMLAMKGLSWIIGAPACVAHDERTALDRLLIALFAGLGGEINVSSGEKGAFAEDAEPASSPNASLPGYLPEGLQRMSL
jgi:hypothetical protein